MHKRTYSNLLKASTLILITSAILNVVFARELIIEKQVQQIRIENQEVEEEKKLIESKEALKQELDKAYTKAIKEAFTKEELANAMQRQWKYIMSVNNEEIKSSSKYIRAGNIRIMVAEVLKSKSALNQELLRAGCIDYIVDNMSMEDLIEVYSTVPYTLKREETSEGIKYYYDFTDVPKETLIILKLNPILTDKLECKENIKENQIVLITKE